MKIIILLLILSLPAFGKTVWYLAPTSSEENFQEFLETDSENTSFVAAYRLSPVATKKRELLSRLFEKAQTHLLAKNPIAAEFEAVTTLALEEDWNPSDKQLLLTAFLRRAQLCYEPGAKRRILVEAASFAPELEPDETSTGPQEVSEFKRVRAEIAEDTLDWDPLATDSEYLILDGRFLQLGNRARIHLLPGKHRVTFLSNKKQPVSRVGSSSEIAILAEPDAPAFVSGDCSKPLLLSNYSFGSSSGVWFSDSCSRVLKKGNWVLPEPIIWGENSSPVPQIAFPKVSEPTESKSILKSPVFWVVTGIIATVAYQYWQSQKYSGASESPGRATPTNTQTNTQTTTQTQKPPPVETVVIPVHREY